MWWISLVLAAPPDDPLTPVIDDAWSRRRKLEIGGMVGLTAWSGASAVGGGVAVALAPDERTRGFGWMTVAWSAVNLGIAVPALAGAITDRTPPADLGAWRREEAELRTAFIFNTGLDVGWVALGGLLWERGLRTGDEALVGAGQAAVSQGGFLLAFDLGMSLATGAQARRFWATPVVGDRMGVQVGGRW